MSDSTEVAKAAACAAPANTEFHGAAETPLSRLEGHVEVRRVAYTDESVARGVFAVKPIPRGALIEDAHCIRISKAEHDTHCEHTILNHYTFCAKRGGDFFLALGLGSLFNHYDPPNVDYRVQDQAHRIEYYAARDIAPGEELFIYYGPRVWFDDPLRAAQEAERAAMGPAEATYDFITQGFEEGV